MHLTNIEEVETELQAADEADFLKKVTDGQQKATVTVGETLSQRTDLFDFRKINYLETHKRNVNFSYMQSLCLIGAYLAGANKEHWDLKIFQKNQQKFRQRQHMAKPAADSKNN